MVYIYNPVRIRYSGVLFNEWIVLYQYICGLAMKISTWLEGVLLILHLHEHRLSTLYMLCSLVNENFLSKVAM